MASHYGTRRPRGLSRVPALERRANARRDAGNLRHNNCQTDCLNCQPGNASTPTEPTGRCLLTSDCRSETGNYKGRSPNCQAPVRQGIPSLITGSVRGVEIGFVFDRGYVTDIIKCQTPHAIPPSNKSKNTAAPKTINLNFLYRLLSGGARDP